MRPDMRNLREVIVPLDLAGAAVLAVPVRVDS